MVCECDEASERGKIRFLRTKRVAFVSVGLIAIFFIAAYSFTIGQSSLQPLDAYKILINYFFPGTINETFSDAYIFIVSELRAPRVTVAALTGAVLAIGGCLLQSILRNPLATPYTLGVSSGGGLGASLYFVFGISLFPGVFGLILNSLMIAMVPAVIMLVAMTKKMISPTTMILAGVSISYIFTAISTILQYFADNTNLASVMMWSVGDLNFASLWMVPYLATILLAYLIFTAFVCKDMDIMRMGDDTAASLGVNVKLVRGLTVFAVCLMTAVAVSFVGPIGFVCLLAPHISRKVVGNGIKWLMPASAVVGAIILLIADIISKGFPIALPLPVGAVTALIGAPVLVYMLFSKKGVSV